MTSKRLRRTRLLVASGAVASLVLVGCGDDDGEADAGATAAEDTTSAEDAEPYRVMVLGGFTQGTLPIPPFPEAVDGAEAAAREINDAGGVDGHPIEIVPCDTKWDSNAAVECANQAADEGVLAIIGAGDTTGDYFDVLEAEQIPSVAPYALFRELTSPMSYPIMGGVPSLSAGMFSQLAAAGIEDVAFMFNGDASASAQHEATYAPVVANFTGLEVTQIPIAEGATDLSAAVASAGRHGGITALVPPLQMIPIVSTLRQSGLDLPVVANSTGLDVASIDELGDRAEGLQVTSLFVPPTVTDNEGVAAFLAAMEANNPDAKLNDTSQNAYLGVKTFAAALQGLEDVTREAVIEALDTMPTQDFGMLAPFSFAAGDPSVPDFPRLFNPNVVYGEVRDGTVVPMSDEFNNAFTGQPVG